MSVANQSKPGTTEADLTEYSIISLYRVEIEPSDEVDRLHGCIVSVDIMIPNRHRERAGIIDLLQRSDDGGPVDIAHAQSPVVPASTRGAFGQERP